MASDLRLPNEQIAFMQNVTGLKGWIVSIDSTKPERVLCVMSVVGEPESAELAQRATRELGRALINISYSASALLTDAAPKPLK